MTHIFFSNPAALPPEDLAWCGAYHFGLWTIYGQTCPAAVDVLRERVRQVEAEGCSTVADDAHTDGQLPLAALCYVRAATFSPGDSGRFPFWPFRPESYKPGPDPRRNLVKAAALILAEIERLDRAEAPAT